MMLNLRPLLSKYWKIFVEVSDQKRIDSQTPPEKVKTVADIPYIEDGKAEHLLDIYSPEESVGLLPVIIDIHGGGWMYGTKEINKYYNMTLASKGYTVFSINYTLVPLADIAVQLRECMLAFSWIKEHAEEYGGDLSRLYVTGDSAGGFLAAFSTLLNNSQALREIYDTVSPGIDIKGVCLTCPVCYMDEKSVTGIYTKQILGSEYKSKKYNGYVNLDSALALSSMPPVYLITCKGDLPAKKATFKAYEDLQDNGVKCKLKYLPDKKLGHVFCIVDPFSPVSDGVNNDMLKFLRDNT